MYKKIMEHNDMSRFSLSLLAASVASAIATGSALTTVNANPSLQAVNQQNAAPSSTIQLYGQVPQPNQIRQGYVVFQRFGDQLVGAYYQPRSEFSCFVGGVEDRTLAMNFFSRQGETLYEAEVSLTSLYNIDTISNVDRRVIKTCQQQMPQPLALTN